MLAFQTPTAPPSMSKTSVFNALGSYADRIRDASSSTSPPAANGALKSPTPLPAARLPGGAPSHLASAAASSSSSPAPAASSDDRDRNGGGGGGSGGSGGDEDDGAWETVTSVKARSRPERFAEPARDSRANKSRNWREKDEKTIEVGKEREAQAQQALAVERSSSAAAKVDGGMPAAQQAPAEKARSASASAAVPPGPRTDVTPAPAPKSVWGVVPPAPAANLAQMGPTPTASVAAPPPKPHSRTAPPSPSLGTTTTSSVPPSLASPNLSADTESTTTTSLALKTADSTDDEGSWRARSAKEDAPLPPQAPPKQPAPLPAFNPWDLRKKKLGPSAPAAAPVAAVAPSAPSTPAAQPDSIKPSSNGEAAVDGETKTAKKAPKKKVEAANGLPGAAAAPPLNDTSMWPDVAQAAEVAKSVDEKRVKKDGETGSVSVADEPVGAAGKKPKWTPIPAAELQEAADKAAESSRKTKSAKRGARPGDVESTRGRKGPTRGGRPTRAGSADEIRLPPAPEGARLAQPIKFGTVGSQSETSDVPASSTAEPMFAATTASAPLSRQTSRQSTGTAARRSPGQPLSGLPSPEKRGGEFEPRAFPGGVPYHPFSAGGGSGRPPRGRERDGRGGFVRGRGGSRGGAPMRGFPGMAEDGGAAQPYSRSYGMGYNAGPAGFYPPPAGFVAAPVYDAQAAGAMGLPYAAPGIPFPPMPATVVPKLDPLRFYVLGQVEYYFSMTNLVMDFFLRQQMDSEGWIDVAMIASFNRVKSLTPDASMIRDVMALSTLLELREDKVRLAGADAKRWVLPDAKASRFAPDPADAAAGGGANGARPVGASTIGDNKDIGQGVPNGILAGVGVAGVAEDRPFDRADVQSALLKNGGERANEIRSEAAAAARGAEQRGAAKGAAEVEGKVGQAAEK